MKRISKLAAAAGAVVLLTGCLGNAFNLGSSAPAPTDVKVVAGDSSATVSWTAAPNVQYWLFGAAASTITSDNWNLLPGGRALIDVSSPQLVTGLVNGVTYSFTVNGRVEGGPGGAGSPSISVVPRLAGGSWDAGSPLAGDLRGVTFGTVFVAVGSNGALYSSPDFSSGKPVSWTTLTNPLATPVGLNAAIFSSPVYVAAGAGGVILTSSDAVTWTARSSGTTNTLYGLAANGFGGVVAVGEKGTIVTSGDGVNWLSKNSGTTNDLFGVTYGNGVFMAVGANGTVLASADTNTWLAIPSNTTLDLRGIAFGVNPNTGANEYVAVGAAGTIVSSNGGVTWTLQAPVTSRNLNAITYNRQFIMVGDGGTVITSTDGNSMQLRTSGTSSNLTAVTHSLFGLSAVGAAGTNISSL